MAKNSTTVKPAKPHPDYPLFPHATGRWAKKVRGDMKYFGPWNDPDGALNRWLEQKDDLLAGRRPRPKETGLTLKGLFDRYMTAQETKRDGGELTPLMFQCYLKALKRVTGLFGVSRLVSDVTPEDWGKLRAELAKTLGPVSLAVEIQRIRTAFNWGYQAGVTDTLMRFGPDFKKPSRRTLRAHRQSNPKRFLTREQILDLIDRTGRKMGTRLPSPELKAAILLGINCGWGNGDIAGLNVSHIDFAGGMADYPRPKTHIERRAPLWPETLEALKVVLQRRERTLKPSKLYKGATMPPSEVAAEDRDAVFLTKFRQRYVIVGKVDSIGLAFGRLLREAGYKQEGINFYALRHTFRTIAGEVKDPAAVDRMMGHTEDNDDTGAKYQEWTRDAREDARLRAVSDHVHGWLWKA